MYRRNERYNRRSVTELSTDSDDYRLQYYRHLTDTATSVALPLKFY